MPASFAPASLSSGPSGLTRLLRTTLKQPVLAILMTVLVIGGLSACAGVEDPLGTATEADRKRAERGTITGEDGFVIFGGDSKKRGDADGGSGIGVNSFLWRASLDTISFMPVSSADPFGGVIITDWHATSGVTNERFKMNVYILGRALRADGVRVAVFRQVLNASGQWQDAPIAEGAATKIEDSILTRARQLRNQALLQE